MSLFRRFQETMRNTDVHSTHLTKKKKKGREEVAEREWEGKNKKRKRLRRNQGKKEWEGGRPIREWLWVALLVWKIHCHSFSLYMIKSTFKIRTLLLGESVHPPGHKVTSMFPKISKDPDTYLPSRREGMTAQLTPFSSLARRSLW